MRQGLGLLLPPRRWRRQRPLRFVLPSPLPFARTTTESKDAEILVALQGCFCCLEELNAAVLRLQVLLELVLVLPFMLESLPTGITGGMLRMPGTCTGSLKRRRQDSLLAWRSSTAPAARARSAPESASQTLVAATTTLIAHQHHSK